MLWFHYDMLPLANSTSGHFDLWPIWPLTNMTSGHFDLWPLRHLANATSGHYKLGPVHTPALMNSPYLQCSGNFWPMWSVANMNSWPYWTHGLFELWPMWPLANMNPWHLRTFPNSSYFFFHLVIVWTGFATVVIQERCFIEGLQAWPYMGIALPTLINFLINLFFDCLPTVCPTDVLIPNIMFILAGNNVT